MAVQLSTLARNAALNAMFDTELGASPVLHIRTTAQPADCAAANTGIALAIASLPATAFAAAASGAKAKSGTWQDASADAAGTAAHWRLFKTDGVTAVAQGTVTATGGGGDMTVDNVVFAVAQVFTVTAFTITAANA